VPLTTTFEKGIKITAFFVSAFRQAAFQAWMPAKKPARLMAGTQELLTVFRQVGRRTGQHESQPKG